MRLGGCRRDKQRRCLGSPGLRTLILPPDPSFANRGLVFGRVRVKGPVISGKIRPGITGLPWPTILVPESTKHRGLTLLFPVASSFQKGARDRNRGLRKLLVMTPWGGSRGDPRFGDWGVGKRGQPGGERGGSGGGPV